MVNNKNYLKPAILNKIKTSYDVEFDFITNLFAKINIPSREDSDSDNEQLTKNVDEDTEHISQIPAKTDRARSIEELHERIDKLKASRYTYKTRLEKKRLRNKLRKKKKILEKRQRKTNIDKNIRNFVTTGDVVKDDPIVNKDLTLVFSKLELMGETSTINDRKMLKHDRNPKQVLENLEKRQKFIRKLEQSGNEENANAIREKIAWNNALRKAEGLKVKDDPTILKKTLKKKTAKKNSSRKKWQARLATVEQEQITKQKTRKENIEKRKQNKRKNKVKKAKKKGRFITV